MKFWLKIKIIRDINKLSKYSRSLSLTDRNELLKIESKFTREYLSLIKIIRNTWYSQNLFFTNRIPTRSINFSDLNNFNIDLFQKIVKLKNVTIIETPKYELYYIDTDSQLKTKVISVCDIEVTPTLDYLKKNENKMFYIYQISEKNARWYEYYDKNHLKDIRKEKLKKINS